MDKSIVSYNCKEDKRQPIFQKGASKMKKNNMMKGGFELLHTNPMSANTIRNYWKGSPWRALRECLRSV